MGSEMTPGELADRYEQGGIWVISPAQEKIILKSLRFAADMEFLTGFGTAPELYWDSGQVVCSLAAQEFYGTDIYSAARAAVEALKGRV